MDFEFKQISKASLKPPSKKGGKKPINANKKGGTSTTNQTKTIAKPIISMDM